MPLSRELLLCILVVISNLPALYAEGLPVSAYIREPDPWGSGVSVVSQIYLISERFTDNGVLYG